MDLYKEKIEEIKLIISTLESSCIDELNIFFCDDFTIDRYIGYALETAAYHKRLDVIKYIMNNYIDKIKENNILYARLFTNPDDSKTLNAIDFYKFVKENNLRPGKYKNTLFFS